MKILHGVVIGPKYRSGIVHALLPEPLTRMYGGGDKRKLKLACNTSLGSGKINPTESPVTCKVCIQKLDLLVEGTVR